MLSRLGFLFTFRGRVRRLVYLGAGLAAVAVGSLLVLPAVFLGPDAPMPLTWLGRGLAVVGMLGMMVASFALTVRRLHDMNMSGWHILWITALPWASSITDWASSITDREALAHPASLLLTGAGFVVSLWLMLMPGTKGPNRFGPPRAAAAT